METKHIIVAQVEAPDETLLNNIRKANAWSGLLKLGMSFAEIANLENVSTRRIQHLVELAFLAPDFVPDITEGKQPSGMTSNWLTRQRLPSDWSEQSALIATL